MKNLHWIDKLSLLVLISMYLFIIWMTAKEYFL